MNEENAVLTLALATIVVLTVASLALMLWPEAPTPVPPDDEEREERVRQATAAAQENAKALNAAQLFEIDDVIDPADTRGLIAATLTAATTAAPERPRRRIVDTW